jgi:hypothetical protein
LCLSAAQKEDYGAFLYNRQPLLLLRFSCAAYVQQRGDRTIAKPLRFRNDKCNIVVAGINLAVVSRRSSPRFVQTVAIR